MNKDIFKKLNVNLTLIERKMNVNYIVLYYY